MTNVILTSDNDNLGKKGLELQVKSGFARNYLIPKNIAVYATEYNRLKYRPEIVDDEETPTIEIDLAPIAENLKSHTFNLSRDANTEGTLYGSIRKSEIVEMIESQFDVVDFNIALEDDANAITKTGIHEIIVDLGHNTTTTITVQVDAA